ncbi:MAG: prepilin-type N-terminal cleavage/methylation domain-containing protein [Clostridia bacterium]|nr:prepilin-type N-terminal cleavage/methylation domain-containing protein [Clostridia bacterium]
MVKAGDFASKEAGLTLLEVVAALVLLGVFFSHVLPAFTQLAAFQGQVAAETEAHLLAWGKLEELVAGAERSREGRFPAPWDHYSWRYRVERPADRLVSHTLNLRWRGFLGEREVTVSRLEAE